ncbi:Oidioi.mRNA.OKI2018_I69.PAR.g10918.t1.cds [Oikopleura dioica]|uniref:Oidioi.mRNA.OKI2018_I69.PAR.g10918.t1.cds n=1 Tax=Oikopleura dioica TaxID=34765 RepID=A0ABN7RT18_OIKDI|nr:Oidioi.mRNA.OKI2018_I69.PAR.g10918.t1.cds [Oikopleura dioica]
MQQKMIDKKEKESYLKLIKQLEEENEELYRHNVQLTRRLQEKKPEKELLGGFDKAFDKLGLQAPPFSCARKLLNALTEKITMLILEEKINQNRRLKLEKTIELLNERNKSLFQEIKKIKEEHLEEQNDLMHMANEAQRENRILKTKCRELQHQVDEVEEDLQTTEEETLRMEVKFRKEQKIMRRNSEILQNTARLKILQLEQRLKGPFEEKRQRRNSR